MANPHLAGDDHECGVTVHAGPGTRRMCILPLKGDSQPMSTPLQSVTKYGYVFMGIGMLMALVGIFVLMEPQNRAGTARLISMSVGITGFVVYFIGRVFVSLQRRQPRDDPDNELQQDS